MDFKGSEQLLRGFKHRSDVTDLLALKDCSGCGLWRESRVLGVSVEKWGDSWAVTAAVGYLAQSLWALWPGAEHFPMT